ncbi:MAG TPA: peptidoglycan DD-metalloendopeptidase family protein [Casimicrobiaceae bacterium]|nr:peptidoglycan DD-metalloendopeptidase family protein [Casimicrobiaceae bacterium]
MAFVVCYNRGAPRVAEKDDGMESGETRILAQSGAAPGLRSRVMRVALAAVLMLAGVIGAFALAPDAQLETVSTTRIVRDLALPPVDASVPDAGYWREEEVRRGDTLGRLLARLDVDDAAAQSFLRSDPQARALRTLKPGASLRALTDGEGRLIALRSTVGSQTLSVVRVDGDSSPFVTRTDTPAQTVGLELRANDIRSTLFAAADEVDVPDAVTSQLADIFGGDIDFHHDVHPGDRFTVVYETRRVDGAPVGMARVVAAEFVGGGVAHRAFLWRAADGTEGYYDETGRSVRKAFLRSPVGFTRITSGFSLARFHPFLLSWHTHKGVDFAAPIGTPVHAAAAGRAIVVGQQTGYGNVIMLQHGAKYTTVYAHLSRFAAGLKRGSRVAQGEVIGYVGETGWATGPHLHYELRVDNVQVNPLTVALPEGQPVPASERASYAAAEAPLAAELDQGRGIVLAGGE